MTNTKLSFSPFVIASPKGEAIQGRANRPRIAAPPSAALHDEGRGWIANAASLCKPRLVLAATATLLALAGCSEKTPPQPAPPPPPMDTDCGAGQLGAYIGHQATDEVIAAIRAWRGDNPVRVLKPGSAMTMDYRPGRLNVFLDEQGRIKEFQCN
ncbi:I78 family peptidase inhibitor [Novosphingobium naphthalenivorans]|uniref:I78 family peptidase inhibitor n=1 Tax=Novosphingobium naphthalenivorans TaxID=273168 RepID=UPI000A076F58|nr:I78 family peptidase inhibitor [Novosphingobium naphthalenivorans]